MKQMLREHGILTRVVSDNRCQFSNEGFRELAQLWQFDHITSSLRSSKYNGFVERQIYIVKRILLKAKQVGTDPDLSMPCLQVILINHNLPSSLKLLNNHIINTNIIMKRWILWFSNSDYVCEKLKHWEKEQKRYYDRIAHNLPPLVAGQTVQVLDHQPATISTKYAERRSYILEFSDWFSKRIEFK